MSATNKTIDYSHLNVEERIRLAQEIWDSIADEGAVIELTEAQKAELDRRIAEHEANPDDVVPWEDVRNEMLGQS